MRISANRRAATRTLGGEDPLRRELYFFTLYRLLEASLLVFVVFSPLAEGLVEPRGQFPIKVISPLYLLAAIALLVSSRERARALQTQISAGIALDLVVALFAMQALPGAENVIALMLLVNVGAAALLLPWPLAVATAVAAAAVIIGEFFLTRWMFQSDGRDLAEPLMFAVAHAGAAALCHLLGRQLRESEALAEQRGAAMASLSEMNDLIIRRMRTGVMVVDGGNRIVMYNEAAWFLLGNPNPAMNDLGELAPELSHRLYRWRAEGKTDPLPLALAKDVPEVIPRFARLMVTEELFLLFLDDVTLVSQRAEELTLATLGRLSASIAHEVRNPLAAISYSAQLLDESPDMTDTDHRLVEIIRSHCERMNGIIENILNLARRERSRPEPLDLAQWVFEVVEDFKSGHYLDKDEVKAVAAGRHVYALVDPQHLHQVVVNLILNALTYGRMPGEPARVTLVARQSSEAAPPLIEVIDRGPGIPQKVAGSIFEPFYTTSEHGTGLGLYLARQLCEANQATLDYVPVAGGGSCFRISLVRPRGVALPSMPKAELEPGSA
ncbi:MAG TPA: ATP-binding protein [Xanthomonadaceae bacterium]|nr:ATP-binding protein [Xanthomonadaceae bacterium]